MGKKARFWFGDLMELCYGKAEVIGFGMGEVFSFVLYKGLGDSYKIYVKAGISTWESMLAFISIYMVFISLYIN